MSKYIRKTNSIATTLRYSDPALYQTILDKYAPVFDKSIAVKMYYDGVPPPTCTICGARIQVSKKLPERCNKHSKTTTDNMFTYREFTDRYPGQYISWEGSLGTNKSITVICEVHGMYDQVMKSRMAGHQCQKCYFINKIGRYRIDSAIYLADFEKVHKQRYDYSLVEFCGSGGKIEIICRVHGKFMQAASVHRAGHGCPNCARQDAATRMSFEENKTRLRNSTVRYLLSNPRQRANTTIELKCKDFLHRSNITYVHQHPVTNQLTSDIWVYDFYLPELGILLETDGEYFHRSCEQFNRDKIKDRLAKTLGYTLLRISDANLDFSIILGTVSEIEAHTIDVINKRSKHIRPPKQRRKHGPDI